MDNGIETDICVIGAGSGGLSLAAGASQMGARVVLVEGHRMGGDCLNYGCVPSKALLAAAHAAQAQRSSARFGIAATEPGIDWAGVRAHVDHVIAAIAPNDSVARFEGLGVTVIQAFGHFLDAERLQAGDTVIRAKYFVIATGSRPAVPPIPGLAETPHFTNETIFANDAPIRHLIVLGGGPIGIELAQAHRRLGAEVSVVEMGRILPRDDAEAVELLRRRLLTEGIRLLEGVKATRVASTPDGVQVEAQGEDGSLVLEGSHILVAAGRVPHLDKLDLDKAGVAFDRRGVKVDAGLRSSNKRIFAMGDAAGGPQFTHVAGYHAGVLIRRLLFRMVWAKADYRALPWVTYSDPELAQVGMTEAQAIEKAGADSVEILRWSLGENDRAQAERATHGLIKLIADRKGRILGASILAPHAGELIAPWCLAVQQRLKLGAMASLMLPYPTLGEIGKRAAGSHFTPKLFSEKTKKIVRFLLKFG